MESLLKKNKLKHNDKTNSYNVIKHYSNNSNKYTGMRLYALARDLKLELKNNNINSHIDIKQNSVIMFICSSYAKFNEIVKKIRKKHNKDFCVNYSNKQITINTKDVSIAKPDYKLHMAYPAYDKQTNCQTETISERAFFAKSRNGVDNKIKNVLVINYREEKNGYDDVDGRYYSYMSVLYACFKTYAELDKHKNNKNWIEACCKLWDELGNDIFMKEVDGVRLFLTQDIGYRDHIHKTTLNKEYLNPIQLKMKYEITPWFELLQGRL